MEQQQFTCKRVESHVVLCTTTCATTVLCCNGNDMHCCVLRFAVAVLGAMPAGLAMACCAVLGCSAGVLHSVVQDTQHGQPYLAADHRPAHAVAPASCC
jgi:hypothetical protein